jgi:hypothetical protein
MEEPEALLVEREDQRLVRPAPRHRPGLRRPRRLLLLLLAQHLEHRPLLGGQGGDALRKVGHRTSGCLLQ